MSNIKVRIGQQNAIRVTSSISGSPGLTTTTAESVIGGIASVSQLSVTGPSSLNTFTSNYGTVTGILTVGQYIYYTPGQPYGVAYFDPLDRLVSTGSTSTSISGTNYILTTDNSGIPTWSNEIDGGEY
jgi:hypothetical protein